MWCRFLTFCVLVSFILFVVASCIYGRPSFHLFFHRCCGDDIENDQVIYENFGNNFLKERLVGGDIIEADNGTLFEGDDIGRITDEVNDVLSIDDPEVKKWITDAHISDSAVQDMGTDDKIVRMPIFNIIKDKEKIEVIKGRNNENFEHEKESVIQTGSTLSNTNIKDDVIEETYGAVKDEENKDLNVVHARSYELVQEKVEDATDSITDIPFLNVHDWNHKQRARKM